MDAGAYLERIGYRGPLDVSIETLRSLHLAHLCSVPFENLDIMLGRPIALSAPALFDKIVVRRRGGFCYELNGLFAWLLGELGFRASMLSAGVAHRAGGFGPEFDHLALRVELDEPWLADVGFGEGFRQPLRLNYDTDQAEDDCTYLIVVDGEYRVLLRRDRGGDWTPQYRFTLQPRRPEEFAERCRFQETSPESSFTRDRLCTLATPEGRVTLNGLRLIVTVGAERSERLLSGEREFAATLRQ